MTAMALTTPLTTLMVTVQWFNEAKAPVKKRTVMVVVVVVVMVMMGMVGGGAHDDGEDGEDRDDDCNDSLFLG